MKEGLNKKNEEFERQKRMLSGKIKKILWMAWHKNFQKS